MAAKGLFARMTSISDYLFCKLLIFSQSYFKPAVLACSFIHIIFVTLLLLAMDIHPNPDPHAMDIGLAYVMPIFEA